MIFADGFAILNGTIGGFIVPGSALSAHSNTEWLASVTARLGYVPWDRWLFYVKGGAAWAGDRYNASGTLCTLLVINTGACGGVATFNFTGRENRFIKCRRNGWRYCRGCSRGLYRKV